MSDVPSERDEKSVMDAEAARRAALTPEAQRALREADARRAKAETDAASLPSDESGGPTKVEPTRYGDWERKGIAYDF